MAVDGLIATRGMEEAVAPALLAHYRRHARSLPWRSPPGAPPPAPYRVWLSEIMLQQTTVAAVAPYYERFLARWPTVEALAAAEDGDLMAAWAGLGYYARARNLLACARYVAGTLGGRFPSGEPGLRALPGVGAYTAAAVAAIAFGQRAVVVDGNVERVVSRLFAVETPLPAGKPILRALADRITPQDHAGDFAQAMMDLGATVCTPRNPACLACPLSGLCAARATGDPARYPLKAAKKARPTRSGTAWWVEAGDAVWLVRRPDKGLLGGMLALPTSDWSEAPEALPHAPLAGSWQILNQPVRHVFTHFALDLRVAMLRIENGADPAVLASALGPGQLWPLDTLADAGLPTVFARAAQAALDAREQENAHHDPA
ncbi:A/G-specific adenine glycosylase [Sphingobium sp. B1D7B]|uniref:A/G-specific adenine glycosylase n=1 Tax=Sphingobium sp. B1D7B TaxID=2940578 RepID=UPI0022256F16|nr:A/G-specific adenine glycosylase [Sphingobium sp. B1D7B]MCW2404978.1 A/G-specific adenine glycosylase [Sphingobium sp. B1D7B]